jgi:hypothetical protein
MFGLVQPSDQLRLQGLGHFSIREHLLCLARPNIISHPFFLQLFSYIAFAAASFLVVLRVYVPDADDQPPKTRHLRKLRRIAIWNTEKSIILITMGVWLANVSSLIEGSYLLQIMEDSLTNLVISQVSYG